MSVLPDPTRAPALVALDLETYDPLLETHGPGWAWDDQGHITGAAVAWDGYSAYLPWRTERNRRWVADLCADPTRTLVVFNAHYDLGWLRRAGIVPRCQVWDAMFASALVNEYERRYNLNAVGLRTVGRGKDDAGLVAWAKSQGLHPKRDMWKAPPEVVAPYAKADAQLTYDLHAPLLRQLEAESLVPVLELELALVPVVQEMRWSGIRIDVDAAEQLATRWAREEAELQLELNRLAGFPVRPNAGADLARAFDHWGLPYGETPTGRPQFRKEALHALRDSHAGVAALLRLRRLEKARGTFVEGLLRHVRHDGRVHGELIQLPSDSGGTVTGRFSSAHPNLQNQPAKDPELGPLIRSLFLPEEGQEWVSYDYSQQEPRLMVHYATVSNVEGVTSALRAYREDPATDFHGFVAQLTGLPRSYAKVINLGLAYGMGGAKLCHALGLPTETYTDRRGVEREKAGPEGQAILDQYHQLAPFVRGLTDACARKATRRGWIKTLGGRRCRFGGETVPGREHWAYPYQAMNRLIQGSAADQTKLAMVQLWGEGITPLVQVHDELAVSCDAGDTATRERVAEIMEHCVQLHVPSKVDVARAANWGATM